MAHQGVGGQGRHFFGASAAICCAVSLQPRGGAVCGKVVAEVWWIGGWDGLEETIRKLDLGPVETNIPSGKHTKIY